MLTRITRQVSRMFDLNLLYRIGEVCARERLLWGVVCYYSGYCLQVIFREVFAMYMAKSRDIRVRLSRLQTTIPGELASAFAIIGLAVNFFWEIDIYICDSWSCSHLFPGYWHLHLRFSGLQSTFSGKLTSTFVRFGLVVNYFREIGIYICDCRACSQLFPEN